MDANRVLGFVHRHRLALFAAWLIHAFLLHYFVIGFVSWDGITYRVPPMVELVQHGSLGTGKYDQWAFAGYIPFVELVQAPFLWLLGLPGLLVGFPLVVLPLCVLAVYKLLEELTGEPRAATAGAIAYLALPFVNQQPFSGYVDFAVCGALAFFVFAVLRLRTSTGVPAFVRLALATFLFTMSRTQAVYLIAALFPPLAYALWCRRRGWRLELTSPRALVIAVAAIAVGAAPAIAIQVWKYLHYGTPTYPLRFELLGFTIGHGMTRRSYLSFAGIPDESARSLARAFMHGWLYVPRWPRIGFYDSRQLGGGLMLVVAVAFLPAFVRRATRVEGWLVAVGVALSWFSLDYAHPRWAYTLTLAIIIIVGRTLPALAAGGGRRVLFWLASGLVLLHLARPELDLWWGTGPRVNVTASPWFQLPRRDRGESRSLELFPDVGARLLIAGHTRDGFVLQLYGRRLTNTVVGTVRADGVGPACTGLVPLLASDPDLLVVDDLDLTHDCARECAIGSAGACRAYRLQLGP